jgi:DNA-binding PadR family transcriptional regulator
METLMRNFPWFWQQDGDAWEATLHRGGPHGRPDRPDRDDDPRKGHLRHHLREHARAHFGPGGPGEPPPPPPPPGWGPGGRGRGGNPFGGNPFGGNPFGGNPFNFGPFGPGGRGGRGGRRGFDWGPFGRSQRVRKGDVRAAVLVLLAEQPRNGYQIIQEIAERSDGMWKPSSGSVYPALQQLEDEGLVETDTQEGRRTFKLTEAGRTYVESHKTELGAPWEAMKGDDESSAQIHHMIGQIALAVVQVSQAGTPAQVERARQVLVNARRSLYQILAEDDGESEAEQVD